MVVCEKTETEAQQRGDKTRVYKEGLSPYLIEVVVAQTVGKIHIRRFSWNRIPTSRRIKPYIHGVARRAAQLLALLSARRSICFCRLQSERAGGRRERERGRKEAAKLTRDLFLGLQPTLLQPGLRMKRQSFSIPPLNPSRQLRSRARKKNPHQGLSDPNKRSLMEQYRRASMRLLTAAAVYKEATRPGD